MRRSGAKRLCNPHWIQRQSECTILSFGVGPTVDFESAVVGHDMLPLKCKMLVFDPKPDALLPDLERIGATYKREGVAGAAGSLHGAPLKTYRTILSEHSLLNTRIDILKLDVDSAEWDIFDNILSEGCALLQHVDQILVTFHMGNPNGPPLAGTEAVRFKTLMPRILACGFRVFYRENHQHQVCCSEFALVSDRFLDKVHDRFAAVASDGKNLIVDAAYRDKLHQRNARVAARDLATRELGVEPLFHWFDPTYDCELTLRYSDHTRE